MGALKARVRNGRLVMDEPTDLPEGTELDLIAQDHGDDLNDDERALLHAELRLSWNEAAEGKTVSSDEVLAKLRSRQ